MRTNDTAEVTTIVTVYSVTCECGEQLDFNVATDIDSDLNIRVDTHVCEQVPVEEKP